MPLCWGRGPALRGLSWGQSRGCGEAPGHHPSIRVMSLMADEWRRQTGEVIDLNKPF